VTHRSTQRARYSAHPAPRPSGPCHCMTRFRIAPGDSDQPLGHFSKN